MRNRVAPAAGVRAATSRLVLVMVLVPAALVAAANSASAAPAEPGVVAESAAFGLLGPVGIGAVVLGFAGLLVGLLRLRRRGAGPAATAATVRIPVDASGTLPVLDTTEPIGPVTGERVG